MGLPEKVAHQVAMLPPTEQAEVLDFVEFLASRLAARVHDDGEFLALALGGVIDEDDPVVYQAGDCREVP